MVCNQFNNVIPSPVSDAPQQNSNNDASSTVLSSSENDHLSDSYPFGLTIPNTPAVALPSVRISTEEDAKVNRRFYGGAGDKPHLGGFTSFDPMGVSPTLW